MKRIKSKAIEYVLCYDDRIGRDILTKAGKGDVAKYAVCHACKARPVEGLNACPGDEFEECGRGFCFFHAEPIIGRYVCPKHERRSAP